MIYLDHAASTGVWPAVVDCLAEELAGHYANPSSSHRLGHDAAINLAASRKSIANQLGCQPGEVVLTSGGTESSNMAIKGFCETHQRLGRRIITSRGEHAATRETCAYLKRQGYEVADLPLVSDGTVDLAALEQALRQPAALISLIHVNNETGAVNPIAEIVRLRNQLQPGTAIHLDSVQAFGKLPFHFAATGVDLVSGSGHKIGAPIGIGWLLVKQKTRLEPLLHGGGQQEGRRSGTENPPSANALALALQLSCGDMPVRAKQVVQLRQTYLEGLQAAGVPFRLLSPENGVPHILSIAFSGLPAQAMMQAFEEKDIMVGTGSACSSRKAGVSPVLRAMGVPDEWAACAIRISLAATNTQDEMIRAAEATAAICQKYAR
jgi:cysteine desulfurase